MRVASCADCVFWHHPEGGLRPDVPNPTADQQAYWAQAGECRRHAPGPALGGRTVQWPVTTVGAWCGEGDDGREDAS